MSFYPGKNLGAYGDAGAVLTESAEHARRVRLLGDHGSERRYEHLTIGFNSRLDTLQAVVLRAKLRGLAADNQARRQAASRYAELLADLPDVILPGPLLAMSTSGICTRSGSRVATTSCAACTTKELVPGSTTRCQFTFSQLSGTSATGPATSRSPRLPRGSCCRFRFTRRSPTSSKPGWPTPSGARSSRSAPAADLTRSGLLRRRYSPSPRARWSVYGRRRLQTPRGYLLPIR